MSDHRLEGFPLSPQQRDLWRWEGRSGTGQAWPGPYRTRVALEVEGAGADAVAGALRRTVARHEILRTAFRSMGGMRHPLQVPREGTGDAMEVEVHDLAGRDGGQREDVLDQLWQNAADALFDLGGGGVLHASLATLGDERCRLVLALPALCADAVTTELLAAELLREVTGAPGEEPLQYADVAEWLNGNLTSPDGESGRERWARRDLGALRRATLPFVAGGDLPDRRPDPRSLAVPLDGSSLERLEEIAASGTGSGEIGGADLVAAAWATLLARLCGRDEILLGCVADGRPYAELSDVVGPMERVLPVPVGAGGRAALPAAAAELRRRLEADLEWQDLFTWSAAQEEEAGEEGDGGDDGDDGGPLHAPWQMVREPAAPAHRRDGVTVRRQALDAVGDRFLLRLAWRSGGDGGGDGGPAPALRLDYDAARVTKDDAARLAGQLATALEAAAAEPSRPMHRLPWLSAPERRTLVDGFQVRRGDRPPAVDDVVELFDRRVRETADAPALVGPDATFTYGELQRAGADLAARLHRRGAGPGTVVALAADRRAAAVVGMLGILRAGAAWVPLEPGLPETRVRHLWDASGASLLVAAQEDGLADLLDVAAVAPLGEDWRRAEVAPPAGEGDDLAYVMMTSGTSGRPKGVAVERRHLACYVAAALERLPLEGARTLLVSTLAADLGLTSLFGALCGGGTLYLVDRETASDPAALADVMEGWQIEVMKVVPSHLAALLRGAPPHRLLPRRALLLGGEATPPALARALRGVDGAPRIFNHYGPSETTVGVLTFELEDDPDGPLPLDRPLRGNRVYLLDRHLRPVARWQRGELVVGGDQVARGYRGCPSLTAEVFVPDPLSGVPGARLYRTGDLARFRSDGALDLLGRSDDQVKVRGYRVEPAEVTAALREHPAVARAVVLAETVDGEPRLLAWVVPAAEEDGDGDGRGLGDEPGSELRPFLARRLPEPMIPATFVPIPEVPVTANGKLDRGALPRPRAAAAGGIAPRDAVETVLAGIWAEVLERDGVGVEDDFFALGGHSLMVARVASRIRSAFGVDLPLRDFFALRTVEAVAERVRELRGGVTAPPLEPAPRDGSLPLSYSQRRLWFHDRLHPGSTFYNMPVPVMLHGPLDVAALGRALGDVVARHEVLRTTYREGEDGDPVQVVGGTRRRLPRVDLSALAGATADREAARLADLDARRPFDLERGPVLRSALVRVEGERHLLLLTLHHIAGDAWSMALLVEELSTLYRARLAGDPSPLPTLPVQYADFAVWQRRWLDAGRLDEELAWWREELAGAPVVLEIPTDHPRPERQARRGARCSHPLPAAVAGGVERLARQRGATPFMVLLTAFAVLLGQRAGRRDMLLGTNVANRDRLETERLIGFFVNQLALRVRWRGDPAFAELVDRVRGVALGAYDHQHLPFERLVEELQPPRDPSRSVLYQYKLDFGERAPRRVELGEVSVEPFAAGTPLARYDLHLVVSDGGDGYRVTLLYDAALFDEATVRRFAADFESVLSTAVEEPERPLSALTADLAAGDGSGDGEGDGSYESALRDKLRTARRTAVGEE